MGAVVGVAVKWVAGVLAKEGIGAFIIKTVALVSLNLLASALFGPKTPAGRRTGTQVMQRSSLAYHKIVYGQAAVSGPIWYNNLSGDNNEYLWYCIALTVGESEDLVSVLFDNNVIPKADIAWTVGSPTSSDGTGTGNVSTSEYVGANSTAAAQIFYYLGADDQPVCGALNTAFSDIGTNHRARGVTHLVVKLLYDEDTKNIWKLGAPGNIRAVIKGRKIYDPRLDTTNGGSGSHRYTDSTTWEWSENPALCVADYLMNFMGVDPTSIDWTSVADSADDCEVSVDIPTASTEDRFTCNGSLSLGDSHKDNLDSILSSMDGKLSYSAGVWTIRASVWEASSVTITADDLAGPVQVRGSAPKSERFSTVRGFFTDPARNYEPSEFPHVSDSAYLTRDNSEEITYDLQLPMTNAVYMAQRIAMRLLEQGDNQIICTLHMNAKGAKVAVSDVVSLTIDEMGWSAKTFRCIGWERNSDGSFKVTLKEDTATRYTDPAEVDYGSGNVGGISLPTDVVPPPSNLWAGALSNDTGIVLTWDNPPSRQYDEIIIYEDTNSSWAGATEIARVKSDTHIIPHDADGTQYYYWIRAAIPPDRESIRDPDSDTSTITATMNDATPTGPAQLTGAGLTDTSITTTDASVGYQLSTSGKERSYEGIAGSYADIDDWLISGSVGDYDCKLIVNSGDTPAGSATSSWLSLSSTRSWTLTDTSSAGGELSNSCTIKIRNATTLTVIATATVTMWADESA